MMPLGRELGSSTLAWSSRQVNERARRQLYLRLLVIWWRISVGKFNKVVAAMFFIRPGRV